MVATNAAGSRAYRFGATRDWVVGLTVELASGRTLALRRGSDRAAGDAVTLADGGERRTAHLPAIPKPRTKNSIGYGFVPGGDVLDLFIGSEGTLGVVSEVTFRLTPATLAADVPAVLRDAGAGVHPGRRAARRRALRTTAIEFLDARSHELAGETGKPEVARVLAHAPAGSCSVFAEFGYDDEAALETTVERVLAHVAAAGGDEAAGLAGLDDQALNDIRAFRHAVPERINATIARRREQHPALHKLATDMAVEDKDLRWVYDLYETRLTEAGPRPRHLRARRQQPFPRQHPAQGRSRAEARRGHLCRVRRRHRRPRRLRVGRARHRADQEALPADAVRRRHDRGDARRQALARPRVAAQPGRADRPVTIGDSRHGRMATLR